MSEQRAQRIAEAIKEEVSELLRAEIKDPRVGFASVVKVEVSRDLRHAKVFVSVLGDEAKRKETLTGLTSALGFIRTEISRRLQLRFAPELEFRLDDSIEHGVRIAKLLNDVRLGQPAGAGVPEATEASPPEKE